jgi:hypothetical protein
VHSLSHIVTQKATTLCGQVPQALCGFYKSTVGEIEYYGDKPYPLILCGGKQLNYDSVNEVKYYA